MVLGAAAVGGEVNARERSMPPTAGAPWPIKVSVVTDPDAVHVVKVAVGQSV